jgi:hypothetical protein
MIRRGDRSRRRSGERTPAQLVLVIDSDKVEDADPEQHIGTVRIANEPMHRWAMSPALVNPAALVRTVKRVIPETA